MRKDMNFFSQFSRKKRGQESSDIYVYLLVGIVLTTIIVTLLYNSIAIFIENKSIADYNTKLNDPEIVAKITESNKVNDKINALTKYDKELGIIINEVGSRDAVTSDLIAKIYKGRPDVVKIESLNISSTEVTMTANSTNKVAIAEFENYLGKLDRVQSVHIGSIAGIDKFTFDVKCVLKDVE